MELKNYPQTLIRWIWLLGAGSGYIATVFKVKSKNLL